VTPVTPQWPAATGLFNDPPEAQLGQRRHAERRGQNDSPEGHAGHLDDAGRGRHVADRADQGRAGTAAGVARRAL